MHAWRCQWWERPVRVPVWGAAAAHTGLLHPSPTPACGPPPLPLQWDLALEALDPHAVGVAVKPLKPRQGTPESVDTAAFEQLLKSSKGRQLRGGGGGGGKGGDKRGFGQ